MRNTKIKNSCAVLIFLLLCGGPDQFWFSYVRINVFFHLERIPAVIGEWAAGLYAHIINFYSLTKMHVIEKCAKNIEYRQHGAIVRSVAFTTVMIARLRVHFVY